MSSPDEQHYKFSKDLKFDCGFELTPQQLVQAIDECNQGLAALPMRLWQSIALKFSGAIIGEFLAATIASVTGTIVNPIEKGHPDVLPAEAERATEEQLRNYPTGLEIKGTCGNIPTGTLIRPGTTRLPYVSGVTWQAHHQEVEKLLGCIWDFYPLYGDDPRPCITAAFYSPCLNKGDWGAISGTTGRNTKVTGMKSSGKAKMAQGLACIVSDVDIINKYQRIFPAIIVPD